MSSLDERKQKLFDKLDMAYPDRIVTKLYQDHKDWAETALDIARKEGYSSYRDMLEANGYTVIDGKAGRIACDYDEIIETLKGRYPNGPVFSTIAELKEANPDVGAKFKSMQNKSDELFGMTLVKYFISIGILKEPERVERPQKEPVVKLTTAEKLDSVIEELKKKYDGSISAEKNLSNLITNNADIKNINSLSNYIKQEKGVDPSEYLVSLGFIERKLSVKEKFENVMNELSERYPNENKKAFSLRDIQEQNPDLSLSQFGKWCNEVTGENGTDYLKEKGIISEYDWEIANRNYTERREAERLAEEEKRKEIEARRRLELLNPITNTFYEPQVYYVEELDVSGEAAKDWLYKDDYISHEGEIFLVDYLGSEEHIILPKSINGRRVSCIDNFGFKQSKAKVIEIPGCYESIGANMCFQNSSIRTLIVGEGVRTILDGAFFNVRSLEEVYVSKSVNMIMGDHAFSSTPWYENQGDYKILGTVLLKYTGDGAVLNVPNGITTICSMVALFRNIIKVNLPESVTTLCVNAFNGRGSENIEEIIYSDSLKNIGLDAFGNNPWIKKFGNNPIIINGFMYRFPTENSNVIIPDETEIIGESVFRQNLAIEKVILPDSLKEIKKSAFELCSNLKEVQFNSNLEAIGEKAFQSCTSLGALNLPSSLKSIGEDAFNKCSNLRRTELKTGLINIGREAFNGCEKLENIEIPNSVKEVGPFAFGGCKELKSVKLSESMSVIKYNTFSLCNSLKNIEIPEAVCEVESQAFTGCNIESITLPANIGDSVCNSCGLLKTVRLNQATKVISQKAFLLCGSLESIIIPEGVEEIKSGAFGSCINLKSVSLPNSLCSIEDEAFSNCSNLEEILIPQNVKKIGKSAFQGCTSLSSIQMPETIAEIGVDAFTGTPYMSKTYGDFVVIGGVLTKYQGKEKTLTLPDNVTEIGENAFAESLQIEKLIIPDSVITIGNKLMGTVFTWGNDPKPALKELVIGNNVKSIGQEAFEGCVELEKVRFGKALETIGEKAFADCNKITELNFENTSLKNVQDEAFTRCYGINEIVFSNCIECIGRNAFDSAGVDEVRLPKTTKRLERGSLSGVANLIVYDTIDPDSVEADEWLYDEWNGRINSPLGAALLRMSSMYAECQGNTGWRSNRITVISSETEEIRYRIFCDSEEREAYRVIMFSGWGKNASFNFKKYDDYFMRTRNRIGRAEMAFNRIMYPEGLTTENRKNYEAYLERCLFIEESARLVAMLIASEDDVDRLKLLDKYKSIDEHNIEWIYASLRQCSAENCIAYLDSRNNRG